MGNAQARFLTADDLNRYEEDTFFTKVEILKVFKLFQAYTKDKKGENPLTKFMTLSEFSDIPELQHNPFRHRIAQVFSNDKKQVGFPEFLDFASVFSEEATREVKIFYAFKIYDLDNDGSIGTKDVEQVIDMLIGHELTPEERKVVVKQVFKESIFDGGQNLSIVEFEHIISRSVDFANTFRIRVV